ncbi:MAG: kelch repeat-containing protein [Chitinophagales bacterium]
MSKTTLQKFKKQSSGYIKHIRQLILISSMVMIYLTVSAQDAWIKKATFAGNARSGATGFSIGKNGYIGTGFDENQEYRKDFWQYDAQHNSWTQKADFGGAARYDAIGFSIGAKGYIGTGFGNLTYYNDFWEYDAVGNTWTQKASFGGSPRRGATAFSFSNRGYVGTGIDANFNYKKDFWSYNPANNTWMQKADFAGTGRWGAVGFIIGKKGYLGTGLDATFTPRKDFWEYKPGANSWTQKADFGGSERFAAVSWSIDTKGYIGTGNTSETYQKDFWEYDPINDNWEQQPDFGGPPREEAVGFSISNKGFVGTGFSFTSTSIYYKDWWQFTPAGILSPFKNAPDSSLLNRTITDKESVAGLLKEGDQEMIVSLIYPNPVQNRLMIVWSPTAPCTVRIYDLLGKMMDVPTTFLHSESEINTAALPEGCYFLQIINNKTGNIEVHKFVKQE